MRETGAAKGRVAGWLAGRGRDRDRDRDREDGIQRLDMEGGDVYSLRQNLLYRGLRVVWVMSEGRVSSAWLCFD